MVKKYKNVCYVLKDKGCSISCSGFALKSVVGIVDNYDSSMNVSVKSSVIKRSVKSSLGCFGLILCSKRRMNDVLSTLSSVRKKSTKSDLLLYLGDDYDGFEWNKKKEINKYLLNREVCRDVEIGKVLEPVRFKQIFASISHISPRDKKDVDGDREIILTMYTTDSPIFLDIEYRVKVFEDMYHKNNMFQNAFGNSASEKNKSINFNTDSHLLLISVTDDISKDSRYGGWPEYSRSYHKIPGDGYLDYNRDRGPNYLSPDYELEKIRSWVVNDQSKTNLKFIVTTTTYQEFFYYGFFDKHIADNQCLPANTVFHFVNRSWTEIVNYFNLIGFKVTGGNAKCRHMLGNSGNIVGRYLADYPLHFAKLVIDLSMKRDSVEVLKSKQKGIVWDSNFVRKTRGLRYFLQTIYELWDYPEGSENTIRGFMNMEKMKGYENLTGRDGEIIKSRIKSIFEDVNKIYLELYNFLKTDFNSKGKDLDEFIEKFEKVYSDCGSPNKDYDVKKFKELFEEYDYEYKEEDLNIFYLHKFKKTKNAIKDSDYYFGQFFRAKGDEVTWSPLLMDISEENFINFKKYFRVASDAEKKDKADKIAKNEKIKKAIEENRHMAENVYGTKRGAGWVNSSGYNIRRYSTEVSDLGYNEDVGIGAFLCGVESNRVKDEILRADFLKDESEFGYRIREKVKKIIGVDDENLLNEVQIEIEEYNLEHEKNVVENMMRNADINEHDILFLKLMADLNIKVDKALENFIDPYVKNGYERLLMETKKNKVNAKLFLLILGLKYKTLESNIEEKGKYDKWKAVKSRNRHSDVDFSFINDFDYKKGENSILANILISVIVNLISNSFKRSEMEIENDRDSSIDSEYFNLEEKDISVEGLENYKLSEFYKSYATHISRYSLTILLGKELIKRAPTKLPELLMSDDNWNNEDDKIFIKKYYAEHINLEKIDATGVNVIGISLLELLIESMEYKNVKVLVESETEYIKKRRNVYISINQKYVDILIKNLYRLEKLPMITPPKKWVSDKIKWGGYLSYDYNAVINSKLIHSARRNKGKTSIGDIQLETVNYLNNQKFKINKDYLTFLLIEFKKDESLFFEGRNRLHHLTDNWHSLNTARKKEVSAHNSRYSLYKRILTLAIMFEDVTFYLPTYMDFRGRIYSFVDYLNYQGEDVAKSLIEFSKGCELDKNNIVYLLQHIANTGGKSKLTILNKNKWSVNLINELNILPYKLDAKNLEIKRINDNNQQGGKRIEIDQLLSYQLVKDIIFKTKDKLQFLIALFNTINYFLDSNHLFSTPICFDATCSGFQHLAALFRDIEIGISSNIINYLEACEKDIGNNTFNDTFGLSAGASMGGENGDKGPGDIYQTVADAINRDIEKIDFSGEEFKDKNYSSDFKENLLKLKIDRKLLKKPVMTVPYNVGLNTMAEQLVGSGFFEKKTEVISTDKKVKTYFYTPSSEIVKDDYLNECIRFKPGELFKFFSILYKGVYNSFPSLKEYINFLNDFAKIFSTFNMPVTWTTPVGMKIEMKYVQFKWKRGKNLYNNKPATNVNLPILSKIDKTAGNIAFIPNFIHSMDSANIQYLIKNLIKDDRNINLFTIHDCFATTPDSMQLLNSEIRKAFSMMYFEQDYIKNLYKDFMHQINMFTQIYKRDNLSDPLHYQLYNHNEFEGEELFKLNKDEYLFLLYDKKASILPELNGKKNIKMKKSKLIYEEIPKTKYREIIIPKIPYNMDNYLVKEIFEKGIKNSLYFIN